MCLPYYFVVSVGVCAHGKEMKACGVHVSISYSGHRLQRGEGNWVGWMMCFLWLPTYYSLRSCVICTYVHWSDD